MWLVQKNTTWYNGITAELGIPTVDLGAKQMLLDAPVEANRIIHSRKLEGSDVLQWLMQLGSGDNAWYAWLSIDEVDYEPQLD